MSSGKNRRTIDGLFNRIFPDRNNLGVLDPTKKAAAREAVLQLLRSDPSFSAREVTVTILRFGLESQDGNGETLRDIGGTLQNKNTGKVGVAHDRVRQLEERALRKLRYPSKSRLLRKFTTLVSEE
jgi:RNA polymerase primary sigma factor